ncbi:NAC domain containing protein 41 [Abeliophyllum distichum]|uniref:NAC domain containing protein 41 n=1 Tax=Abeliophyllum distichum TaxID=126358 RepID=A0ABD1SVE6_9LAMI
MAFSSRAGYRFMPTDQQVIVLYLQAKANGLPLPSDAIIDKDLYGKNGTPWFVFSENDPWKVVGECEVSVSKKEIFVFTKLSKMGKHNIERIAGCGTWGGKSKPKYIKNCNGEVIGIKKSFTFKVNGDLKPEEMNMENGHWIMHEYTLAGISLEGVKNEDYAVCRIMWDFPKCLREDKSSSVVESGFGTVEKIDESRKRKFEFEYPNEKRVCIEKSSHHNDMNSGIVTTVDEVQLAESASFLPCLADHEGMNCYDTTDMPGDDVLWIDELISFDDECNPFVV